ncbi:MAG: hypothetical protein JXA30_16605, partial [Deltaproteobacteria bacterium]|nr:hypothetical protein [Deltaproteobacteria bacterium]
MEFGQWHTGRPAMHGELCEPGKPVFHLGIRKGGSIVWKSLSGSGQGEVTTTAQRLGRDAFRE